MSRSTLLIGLCGALLVAGCQTDGPDTIAVAASVLDAPILASDELGRLGRQDIAAGNSGLAEQHFREAVEKNRNDGSAWVGLAAAYDNLKRFDLADRAYAQAIKLQGETPALMNNIGYSYYLRGDRRRALAQLRRAAILDPANTVIANNIRLVQSGEQSNRRAGP